MIKVGIIGCGLILPMHKKSLLNLENVKITAICDIDESAAKRGAEGLDCNIYTDYKKMIDTEELDTVHILTPHYLHSEMAVYAAQHGVNILTEKPMATNEADAVRMIEAAKENNVTLGVIFQNRYNEGSVAVKEAITSGKLGKIIGARFRVSWFRDAGYYNQGEWRGKWATEGGGVLINQAIHTLDLTNWLIDDEPEFVSASIANRSLRDVIEVEDEANGYIRYKNGAVVNFSACNYYKPFAQVEIEIGCENGTANITGRSAVIKYNDGKTLKVEANPNSEDDIFGKGYWGNKHFTQIKQYYNALKSGVQPHITGEEAYKTHKILYAIYKSGRENIDVTF